MNYVEEKGCLTLTTTGMFELLLRRKPSVSFYEPIKGVTFL